MAQDRKSLERQLENAKASLSAYEQRRASDPKKKDLATKADPQWRSLDKARRNIVTRLKRVEAIEQQVAEMAERRGGGDSE